MLNRTSIRVLVAVVAIVALLVLTAAMTGVGCHHSDDCQTSCPICHLNHQPIEKPLTSNRLPVLAPVAPSVEVQVVDLASSPVSPRVPCRAPPLA